MDSINNETGPNFTNFLDTSHHTHDSSKSPRASREGVAAGFRSLQQPATGLDMRQHKRSSGTAANITNGVLETDLYATGVGNDNNYQFATSQKGTFPWSPCQQPATGVIPANLTIVRSTFTPLALPTTGRYHIYIALYHWLPNGAVSARGATYRCLDTQSRVESIGGTFSTVGTNATYDPGDSFGWNNVTLSNITIGTSTR